MNKKKSNIQAKIRFFAPQPSQTSGLGGSALGISTSLSTRPRTFKDKTRLNLSLHLLCDVCYKIFDENLSKPYIIVPCGHPICMRCSQAMTTNKCPTCMRMISQKVINWGLLIYMQNFLPYNFSNRPQSRPKSSKYMAMEHQGQYQQVIKNMYVFQSLSKHSWSVLCLKELSDGERFASGSLDNTVKIWKKVDDRFECQHTLIGHNECVNCLELLNSYTLISGSNDGSMRVWNLNSFSCDATLFDQKYPISCIRLLPGDSKFVSTSQKQITIWDALTFQCVERIATHEDFISDLEIICYDERLATSSWDKTIKVYDLEGFKWFATMKGHTGAIKCLATITNNRLASGSDDKSIRIWELDEFSCTQVLIGHTNSVNCLILMSNNRLASGSADWTIRIWSLSEFYCMNILNGHCNGLMCLTTISDNMIASGSNDWSIKVWKDE